MNKLFTPAVRIVFAFIGLITITGTVLATFNSQRPANAAYNLEINYQGKLTNGSNVAVADGDYNMEFELYDSLGSGNPPTGGTLLWTETRTGANKVTVTNGVFSVMLGEVNPFGSLDFNQTLYLAVNIGGTGTPSWDGDMAPRKKIGSVPTAFLASNLKGTGLVDITNTATQATFNYDGSNRATLGVASNGFTTLTAVGAGAGFNLTGGNVGIGTASTSAKLHVTATTEQLRVGYDAGNYSSFTTSSGGDLTIAPSGSDLAITGNIDVSGTLTSGTGDAFTVNSSGAITAATGVTSSGTITLSGLGGGGTQCVNVNNTGVLGTTTCGGALTPWTSAIDADGYALQDALNLEFRTAAGSAPGGTVIAMYADNSGDLTANVLTGKTFNIAVNGADEYSFSSTALAMNSNNITGVGTDITAAAGLTVASGGAGALTLDSASNALIIAATDTSLQRTASGTYTVNLVDGSNTTLAVTNSGAGVANLTVDGTISASDDLNVGSSSTPGLVTITGSGSDNQAFITSTTFTGLNAYTLTTENNSSISGGNLILKAGNGHVTYGADGNDVLIYGGALAGAGANGDVILAHTGSVAQGNVGIGDASPAALLTVGSGDLFQIASNGNLTTSNAGSWTFSNDTNFALTGGVNGLSIDGTTFSVDGNSDRVGIGLAAPIVKLQVAGTTLIQPDSTWSSGDTSILLFSDDNSNYVQAYFTPGANSGSLNIRGYSGVDLTTNLGVVLHSTQQAMTNIGSNNDADALLEINGNRTVAAWGLNGIQLQTSASTFTDNDTAGTRTNGVANSFGTPTFAGTNAVTITNAANLYVASAPTNGTNMTITNAYALWVDSGRTRLDGDLQTNITGSTQCVTADTNGVLSGTGSTCGGTASLQASYNGGNSIETAANTAVVITETAAASSTGDLLQLTYNAATGGNNAGDALQITLDAVDASGTDGSGIRIVIDQTANTGNALLVETDAAVPLFQLDENGGLTLGAASAQTTAITITDTDYTNALSIGDNDITGTTFDLIGTTAVINFSNFDVDSAGAVTAVGVNSGAGLLQGQLGLTVTGAAVNLNASSNFDVNIATGTSTGTINLGGTGAQSIQIGSGVGVKTITIGNSNDDTFSLFSSGLNVSTGGAITGASGIVSSGTIQFSALTSNGPLYTSGGNGTLTTTAPTSGAIGYWSRSGTTLETTTANDIVLIDTTNTTGADLAITNTGVYTGTGVFNLTANNATTGVIQQVNANGLTSGNAIDVTSSAAANFTGALVDLNLSDGTGASSNTGSLLSLTNSGTANANTALYVKHYATGTGNLALRVDDVSGDTTPFVIDGTGAVGIGDSTPDYTLDVVGNIGVGTGVADGLIVSNVNAGDYISFESSSNSIDFFSNSTNYLTMNGSAAAMYFNSANANIDFYFRGQSDNAMLYADSSANSIGIGTSGPDRKLDVLDASAPQVRLTTTDGTVYADLQNTATANLVVTGDTLTSSSAKEYGIQIAPTVNQTSSASYTGLEVSVTETAATTINGLNRLADFRVGGSSKFAVRNDGSLTLQDASGITTPYGGIGSFQNHLVRSEEFDNASWVKTSVTAPTANTQVAPDGSTSAESLATSGSGGDVCQWSGTAAASDTFTFSVWVKSTGTQTFDLRIDAGATSCATANNVTGTAVTHTATTSWQRFSVTQAFSSATGNVKARIFPGTTGSTGTVYAWGAQLDKDSKASTYALTTSGALTNANKGQVLESNFATASGFTYGGRHVSTLTGSIVASSSTIGQLIRVIDNASGTDDTATVRGLEVQSYSGTNINGINTAVAAFGYTFGVHAATTGQANEGAQPAAVFADLDNGSAPTFGNAIRAYSNDATSADLVSIYQETSSYSGNALEININGTFTGNFADFQTSGTSKFKVDKDGNAFATLNTGNSERLCWDGTGGTAEEIFDCTGTPGDLAENFGTTDASIEAMDIVVSDGHATDLVKKGEYTTKAYIEKSTKGYQSNIIGVISTNPNEVYANDIFTEVENPRPVALVGRVPVKVTLENGPIVPGDYITSSNTEAGKGMKATRSGMVVGQALSGYDGSGQAQVIVFVNTGFQSIGNTIVLDAPSVSGLNLQSGEEDLTTNTASTFVIQQQASEEEGSEAVSNILQLQTGDANRFMVSSTGATSILSNLSCEADSLECPSVLKVTQANNELMNIDARGTLTLAGTIFIKDDSFAGSVVTNDEGLAEITFSYNLGTGKPVVQLTAEAQIPVFAQIVEFKQDENGNYTGFVMKTFDLISGPIQAIVHYTVVGKQADYITLGETTVPSMSFAGDGAGLIIEGGEVVSGDASSGTEEIFSEDYLPLNPDDITGVVPVDAGDGAETGQVAGESNP